MSWMIIYLDLLLPASSSDPPENKPGKLMVLNSVLLRMGFTCALPVTSEAVVSYTAIPPLPQKWRYISVALSLEFPPPAVNRHPALWSPDFPHLRSFDTCSRDLLSCTHFNIPTDTSNFKHKSFFCKKNINCFLKDGRFIDWELYKGVRYKKQVKQGWKEDDD